MGTLNSTLFKTESGMIKPYFKDEYATLELDDSIPCIKLTLEGIPATVNIISLSSRSASS